MNDESDDHGQSMLKPDCETVAWITSALSDDVGDAESVAPLLDVSNTVVLEGNFTIADAESMHQQLNAVLHSHHEITIEAGSLSRIDAAGVQLLYAFVSSAKLMGAVLTWASISDELRDSVKVLGLSQEMGLDAQS